MKYDTDKSKQIDRGELSAMLEELGMDNSVGLIDMLIGQADTITKDQAIDFREFYQMYMGERLPKNYVSPNNLISS